MNTEYIRNFCREFSFPQEAVEYLCEKHEQFCDWPEYKACLKAFYEEGSVDRQCIFRKLDKIAAQSGVHRYTVHLLYLLGLTPKTKALYDEGSISEEVFQDTMQEFHISAEECFERYGVWGSFYAEWELGFCDTSLLAFGRLQFERFHIWTDVEKGEHKVEKDGLVISVHIPSGSPLNYEECMQSYQRAEQFYKSEFADGVIPFVGFSWLLYPPMKSIFPKDENIYQWIKDYFIFSCNQPENQDDLWRVYGCNADKSLEELPRNTGFQRRLADWLMQGNRIGYGHGIMFFQDGRVL